MNSVFVLFLIITNPNGGVVTEQFKTVSEEACQQLLQDIKLVANNASVTGICIKS